MQQTHKMQTQTIHNSGMLVDNSAIRCYESFSRGMASSITPSMSTGFGLHSGGSDVSLF